MTEENDFYIEKTLASWDEVAPRHQATNQSLPDDVAKPEYNNLNPDFNVLIDSYGVQGKSVVQLCCNNGVDLLSVKNKCAGFCLGIDGSDAFVKQARELALAAGKTDVEYCQADIYKTPEKFFSTFDVALVTVGVFGWMPDIKLFYVMASALLKPGGLMLIEELHPILGMYEEGEPSYLASSYFTTEPFKDTDGLDYFTYEKYEAKENYWFHHTMTEILMAGVSAKLQLEHFKELHYNVGNYCADLEFVENNPPLAMNLAWRKQV